MNYRCIIIDDEALAIEVLEDYITKFPVLEHVGSFNSPLKAMPMLMSKGVDLIFLDINMPDINGIAFYENLPFKPPVIFTTAYADFAVKGFEINAVDYLLKPISFERFFQAISKLLNKALPNQSSLSQGFAPLGEGLDYIFVKAEYSSIKVDLKNIAYLEGYKDYVKIHLIDESKPLLTLNSIKHYEAVLLSKGFVRIHKRYIVSINKIENISRNRVKMKAKEEFLLIGDSFKDFFYELVVNGNT
ncbi:response regulator transcription factor [Algoriphagus aestuariicola]|uniref:Response regulator transcription factor n=1 Tax=Algoriphagus aestuariicola TaxID=1852016 RepID=A0ABS3BQC9_9BACT|nr:LytTR family DNA-binding domain-containing protein [Algoriphagus aestuariicola]MBN7799874.1 response regulator transcription factor [Algoriphagus aestuariicola]